MAGNVNARSTTVVGNFSFDVKIYSAGGTGGIGELVLELPANAARGFGTPASNIMRHRTSGDGKAITTPYNGIGTASTGTLEGHFLFNANDVKLLVDWANLATGGGGFGGLGGDANSLLGRGLNGHVMDIVIIPFSDAPSEEDRVAGAAYKATNVIPVKLSLGDFDVNSPAIQNWSLEVEYEDWVIVEGVL